MRYVYFVREGVDGAVKIGSSDEAMKAQRTAGFSTAETELKA
jgi:hypothetical protein